MGAFPATPDEVADNSMSICDLPLQIMREPDRPPIIREGGELLTITGRGFPLSSERANSPSVSLTFYGVKLAIESSSVNELSFISPAMSSSTAELVLVVNGKEDTV